MSWAEKSWQLSSEDFRHLRGHVSCDHVKVQGFSPVSSLLIALPQGLVRVFKVWRSLYDFCQQGNGLLKSVARKQLCQKLFDTVFINTSTGMGGQALDCRQKLEM